MILINYFQVFFSFNVYKIYVIFFLFLSDCPSLICVTERYECVNEIEQKQLNVGTEIDQQKR